MRIFAYREIGSKPEDGPQGIVVTGRSLADLFSDMDELCNPRRLEFCEIKEHFFVHAGFFSEHSGLGCSEALIESLPEECFREEPDDEELADVDDGCRRKKKKWRSFDDMLGKKTFEQWAHDVDLYGLRAIGARPAVDHAI